MSLAAVGLVTLVRCAVRLHGARGVAVQLVKFRENGRNRTIVSNRYMHKQTCQVASVCQAQHRPPIVLISSSDRTRGSAVHAFHKRWAQQLNVQLKAIACHSTSKFKSPVVFLVIALSHKLRLKRSPNQNTCVLTQKIRNSRQINLRLR
jgi:hypothetical protein